MARPITARARRGGDAERRVSGDWLDALPPELGEHRSVLHALRAEMASNPHCMALQVQGSVGRGTADRLSDLDLALVVEETAWPAVADEAVAMLRRAGEVIDDYSNFMPGPEAPDAMQVWAQLAGGLQIDLLVMPASSLLGAGPDGRTVYDPDGILLQTDHPLRLTTATAAARWSFFCWHHLAESAKYIARGRAAAAAEWLGAARLAAISSWAAANQVDYAGLANIVAARLGVSVPAFDGLELTYPTLELDSVLNAAIALCGLHERVEGLLQERLGIPPRPLGRWVTAELQSLQAERRRLDSRRARRNRPGNGSRASRPSARRLDARRPR